MFRLRKSLVTYIEWIALDKVSIFYSTVILPMNNRHWAAATNEKANKKLFAILFCNTSFGITSVSNIWKDKTGPNIFIFILPWARFRDLPDVVGLILITVEIRSQG